MKYLAVVPARIGSKRIPQKNLQLIHGVPLIEWTLRAAKGCSKIEETYISSDADAIIQLGIAYGAKSFEKRPPSLALDTTSTFDVICNVLDLYRSRNIEVQSIVLLQPTSPLRTSRHISEAIALFEAKGEKPLQSYSPSECPPQWLFKIDEQNNVIRSENLSSSRSQDLGSYFRINGAIYIINVEDLLRYKTFSPSQSIAYLMNRNEGIDIDEPIDFQLAELYLKKT